MLSDARSSRARVLHLAANRPDPRALGGVSVHVAALSSASRDVPAMIAYPAGMELRVERARTRTLVAAIPRDGAAALEDAIVAALAGTESTVLQVHSPLLGPRAIARAAKRAHVALGLTLHDHALACENYDLLELGRRFCGVPEDLARCDRCLEATYGEPPGSLARHRDAMRELVDAADAIIAPSDSVLSLVARAHPSVVTHARRIDWGVPRPAARTNRSEKHEGPLEVAIVGVLAKEKGRDRLPELLGACRALDVRFHLFGATEGDTLMDVRTSGPRVVVHGAYPRSALASRLVEAGIDLVLLPSIKPETWSLVLSEVAAAGFPVLASNFGALAERVARDDLGFTFDPGDAESLRSLLAELSSDRARVDRVASNVRRRSVRTEDEMVDDHEALWKELSGRRAGREHDAKALELFSAGAKIASQRKSSALASVVAAIRASEFYRDLALRRMLPEGTRRAVEASISKWLGRAWRR